MTPFERYLTNWKSPEFAARYTNARTYEGSADLAALVLAERNAVTVDLEPGDMTRYHFSLVPLGDMRDQPIGLSLWNHGRHGATMILPRDAFAGLAPSYIEDKLGVDEVTAAVLGAFLVQVGSHMGVEQS